MSKAGVALIIGIIFLVISVVFKHIEKNESNTTQKETSAVNTNVDKKVERLAIGELKFKEVLVGRYDNVNYLYQVTMEDGTKCYITHSGFSCK